MDWFYDLVWQNSVAHTIFLLGIVIAAGVFLERQVAAFPWRHWVLFVGIILSHFGMTLSPPSYIIIRNSV
jgi:putative transport protein